ncbi:hypothetical protein Ciccas_013548 [Cichlidogyrus casuarinus]|uniref:Uncharacterized protein n=1 Tax=Cichlidogyrus casuarinus TaxID=1844966 RepID=A0ABD2PM34_9PLAT
MDKPKCHRYIGCEAKEADRSIAGRVGARPFAFEDRDNYCASPVVRYGLGLPNQPDLGGEVPEKSSR